MTELLQIKLSNFAIIEELEIDFQQGMTVITGETGAGKSIVIDALDLALGGRINTPVLREGCDRTDIHIVFGISKNHDAYQWLTELDFGSSTECIIRRSITKDGRSKSYINGNPVTLNLLQQLGSRLVNIHGQHEHQNLFNRLEQLKLLDRFAGHQSLVNEVKNIYHQWKKIHNQIEELINNDNKENRREFLQFQLEELGKLNLKENEFDTLANQHKQLANVDQVMNDFSRCLQILSENDSQNILAGVNEVLKILNANHSFPDETKNLIKLIESARVEIEEAVHELQAQFDKLDNDPESLQEIETRLSAIADIARKHRVKPNELYSLQQRLQAEFDALDQSEMKLSELKKQIATLEKSFIEAGKHLSQSRQTHAKKLAQAISKNMQDLGMQAGKFSIEFFANQDQKPHSHGLEKIEFMVSANAGQSLQPLNKVASGGEISRISLAIQVILAKNITTPILIFDEVDVGIGGSTAEIVGRLLKQLGQDAQVICVTHLAQVAACGDHHLNVSKITRNGKTHTQVKTLASDNKIEEIARMLGGVNITEQTRALAKEMLAL